MISTIGQYWIIIDHLRTTEPTYFEVYISRNNTLYITNELQLQITCAPRKFCTCEYTTEIGNQLLYVSNQS